MPTDERIEAAYHPLEGGSVPRNRKKAASKWLSPGRSCLILCGLFGLLCSAGISFLVYKVAAETWRTLNVPHEHTHANASLVAPHGVVPIETDVVRSFFGPRKDGGVDKFDLKAAIWSRVLQPYIHWDDTPWELVQETTVFRNVPIETKELHAVQRIWLPKALVNDLATSLTVGLMATFVMVPASDRIDPSLDYHTWRTSRNTSLFGINANLPPLSPEMIEPPKDVFRHFLANAGAARTLILRPSDDPLLVEEARKNGTRADELFPTRHLITTSRVTMANDFPVYNFTSYNQTLRRRTAFIRDFCVGGTGPVECDRSFHHVGHFENLIEFDDAQEGKPETATRKGWRYGPFLTARVGNPGPLEHRAIHGNETDDLAFDWAIVYTAASPGKISVGAAAVNAIQGAFSNPRDKSAYEKAVDQDVTNALHAALGLPVPGTRVSFFPTALDTVSQLLGLAQAPLDLHYWMTRSLSTGLPLATITSISLFLILRELVDLVLQHQTPPIAFHLDSLFRCLLSFVLLLPQLLLLFKIEIQWRGSGGWIPMGLSRRKATHSERMSARADARFDWKLRVALGIAFVLFSRFGPSIPPLLRGTRPALEESAEHLAKYHYTLNPFRSVYVLPALRIVEEASQLHLVYRLGVFASQYRLTAFLAFTASLLDIVPRFIWNWHARPDVTLAEVVWLAGEAALCYAACRFLTVKQEEEEEE